LEDEEDEAAGVGERGGLCEPDGESSDKLPSSRREEDALRALPDEEDERFLGCSCASMWRSPSLGSTWKRGLLVSVVVTASKRSSSSSSLRFMAAFQFCWE